MTRETEADLRGEIEQLQRRIAELEASEAGAAEKWSTVLDCLPEHVMTVDLDGRVSYINHTVPGVTREDVIGKPLLDFAPQEFAKSVEECLGRVRSSGDPDGYATSFTRPDGITQHFEAHVTPLFESGEIVGFTIRGADITERKKAEEEARAANQQLRAGEQQLRAANQQLEASNQQLRATEQQLRASNQQLEAANQQLRATEERLRESEERLRLALEAADMGTWRWVPSTNRDTRDGGFNRILGLEPVNSTQPVEDFVGRVHPEDRLSVEEAIESAARERKTYVAEFRIVRPNGEVRWIHDRGMGTYDEQGEMTYMTGAVVDITERRKTEEALRESEDRYRSLVETTREGVMVSGPDGKVMYANPAAAAMLGYERTEEIVGVPASELYDNPEQRADLFRRLMADGSARDAEITFRTKDGSLVYVLGSATLHRDSEGNFVRAEAIFTNVTERMKAEEELRKHRDHLEELVDERTAALRESEERSRSVVQTCLDGFWINDPEGRFVDVNDSYCNMIGYSREELLSMAIPDIEASEKPEETAKHLETVFEQGYDRFETRHRRKNGDLLEIEVSARSQPAGEIVVFLRDVTERKRDEEAIRKYARELEASNAELEAFAYSVSHDLRAPLRAVEGFSQALLEDYPDRLNTKGKDYLQRVSNEARRMAQLIDDLLKLSRVTRAEMRTERVDLTSVAQDVVARLREREPEREAELSIAKGLATRGDSRLLQQMIENLMDNAWKFTGTRPQATIEFGIIEQEGKPAYFVRDNGVGFDMKYSEKLFTPFQRLHGMKEFSGTGIGLSTVHRIVSRHGGRVWFESEVDRGATFYFTLHDEDEVDDE